MDPFDLFSFPLLPLLLLLLLPCVFINCSLLVEQDLGVSFEKTAERFRTRLNAFLSQLCIHVHYLASVDSNTTHAADSSVAPKVTEPEVKGEEVEESAGEESAPEPQAINLTFIFLFKIGLISHL